ncbi:MAG: MBL fold metallo-hydrolase, partial [Bacillota bacterium]
GGILITHEHNDHIRALESFSKVVPVYAHDYTMDAITKKCNILSKHQMNFDNDSFSIGSLDILTFKVSHDATYPLGFCISDETSKITYATDLGYCSKEFLRKARGSDTIVIESNHDLDMLLSGRYPGFLKRRIVSNIGHLSNHACAVAINELAEGGTRKFILSHLSDQNNLPELAYWTSIDYLKNKGAQEGDIQLYVADQRHISCYIGCN